MTSRRRAVVAVGVLVAAMVLGSCQTARVGARCRTPGAWGQGTTYILRCQNKRWTRVMTKADYVRFLLAVQQRRDAEAAATAAVVPPPPPPPPAPPRQRCPTFLGSRGFQVLYVVPADVAVDPSVPAAIRHELALVADWYRRETNGSSPRFLRDANGSISVCVLRLTSTRAQLQQAGDERYWSVRTQIEAIVSPGEKALLAYTAFDSGSICGTANSGFAIVWFGTCGSPNPAAPSDLPFDDTLVTTAHEIVHTMGAAQPCAPHYDFDHPGHVTDTADILYYGQFPELYLSQLFLDPGHDDYYSLGLKDCWDIALAPWWE